MALDVYINAEKIGQVLRDRRVLSFTYEQEWRNSPDAHPLSYSMPLLELEHRGAVVENFLWGLLPDNDRILRGWGTRFGVSHSDPVQLLRHVGDDCAGAVRFVDFENMSSPDRGLRPAEVQWLNDEELCLRIIDLVERGSDGRLANDAGHFSLAGAQYKTALRWDPDQHRWGIPSGEEPTTDILKPVLPEFEHQAWNEHFCLQLAKGVGIPAAESRVLDVCGHEVLVVSRYDRVDDNGRLVRVHQEDMCQALGIHPSGKYESEGGPGVDSVMRVVDASSTATADREVLFRALLLNVLIGGTDAHAKNYSILWDRGPTMVLAPLYDVNSIWPYTRPYGVQFDRQRIRSAMRIGRHYHLHSLQVRHIVAAGAQAGYNKGKCLAILGDVLNLLPATVRNVSDSLLAAGCPQPFIDRLNGPILAEVERYARMLEAP